MGFSPMDGFFLAVFLAVCILVAVVIRCICYRFCLNSCSAKFARHGNNEVILPRHTTPTIIAPVQPQAQQRNGSPSHLPQSGTVFTIYTFQHQDSPDLQRPRTPGPPKYSMLPPADAPPKYEDLFPMNEMKLITKPAVSPPSQSPSVPSSPEPLLPQTQIFASSEDISANSPLQGLDFEQSDLNSVSSPIQNSTSSSPSSSSNNMESAIPQHRYSVDPPMYTTIYPHDSGE